MISPEVMQELLSVRRVLHYLPESASTEKGWIEHEQHLFWAALAQYPQGPWTMVAEVIGTKSARQVMTHGQKLRQKLKRWNERLRSNPATSMLMDRMNVSMSVNLSAGISVEATPTTTDASIGVTLPSHESLVHDSELNAGLMADGGSIAALDEFHLTNANICTPSSHFYLNESAVRPNLSRDTARAVELMRFESSGDVQVTSMSDTPENLPQDLLDDLLEILSDDDLNELDNHQAYHNMGIYTCIWRPVSISIVYEFPVSQAISNAVTIKRK